MLGMVRQGKQLRPTAYCDVEIPGNHSQQHNLAFWQREAEKLFLAGPPEAFEQFVDRL